MKGQTGVDKDSGLIHSVATTAAHVSDVVVAQIYCEVLYGDAGYQGLEKREEMTGREVDCRVAMGPGKRCHLPADGEGAVHGGWSVPRPMSEPRWSTPSVCSRSNSGFGKPGDGAWPKITAR